MSEGLAKAINEIASKATKLQCGELLDLPIIDLGMPKVFSEAHLRRRYNEVDILKRILIGLQKKFASQENSRGAARFPKVVALGPCAEHIASDLCSDDSVDSIHGRGADEASLSKRNSFTVSPNGKMSILSVGHLMRTPPVGCGDGETSTSEDEEAADESSESQTSPRGHHKANADFHSVMIIDRRLDLVTPLSSCFTYESVAWSARQDDSKPYVSYGDHLSGYDSQESQELYSTLAPLPLAKVGQILKAKSTEVHEYYALKAKLKSLEEIRTYLEKLKGVQRLHEGIAKHVTVATAESEAQATQLCRKVLKYEDQLVSQSSQSVLKLSTLTDAMKGGTGSPGASAPDELAQKILALLARISRKSESTEKSSSLSNIVSQSTYVLARFALLAAICGHHMTALALTKALNLYSFETAFATSCLFEKCRLFAPAPVKSGTSGGQQGILPGSWDWNAACNAFNCIESAKGATDSSVPTSSLSQTSYAASSVFAGYVPLTVRLVEELIENGTMHGIRKKLDLIPGPSIEVDAGSSRDRSSVAESGFPASRHPNTSFTLVVFVGGITLGEARMIHEFAAAQGRLLVILTTSIIDSKSFIRYLT